MTGMSPYQAVHGYRPIFGVWNPEAEKLFLVDRLTKLTVSTKRHREQQERSYNKKRKIATKYEKGDMVMIETEPYRQNDAKHNISKKLSMRYQGPYEVLEVRLNKTCRLRLPKGSQLYNVFHTCRLKPYILTPQGKFPERDRETM